MKAYISGQITGLPIEEAKQNFDQVEQKLRAIGVTEIFNPIKEVTQEWPYHMQMEECMNNLAECDCIIIMKNARISKEAQKELLAAALQKLHIRFDCTRDYNDIKLNMHRMSRTHAAHLIEG